MNPIKTTTEALNENTKLARQYANQEYSHAQLKIFYGITSFTSSVAKKTVFTLFAMAALIFASIALALYIGERMESFATGFLVVSGVYAVFVCISLLLRKKMEKYIIQKISAKYF